MVEQKKWQFFVLTWSIFTGLATYVSTPSSYIDTQLLLWCVQTFAYICGYTVANLCINYAVAIYTL